MQRRRFLATLLAACGGALCAAPAAAAPVRPVREPADLDAAYRAVVDAIAPTFTVLNADGSAVNLGAWLDVQRDVMSHE